MDDMVNRAVEGMVCSHFGEDKWELIKAKAGVEERMFLSNERHPDAISSREGLDQFVVGLVRGLGRLFKTQVTIDHCVKRGPMQGHDVFSNAWSITLA
jgi:hypothetical protein